MKMNTVSTDLTINAPAPISDAAKQREFLLSEFADMTGSHWSRTNPTMKKLSKMFNLNAPTIPRSSAEIIAAFKDGKVTIDQKKVDKQTKYFAELDKNADFDFDDEDYFDGNNRHISDKYYGVTFTDLPVADRKGYDLAVAEYEKAKTDIRRKLNILEPMAGLDLLTAFADWTPTSATTKH